MPGIREGLRERLLAFARVTSGVRTDISVNASTITRGAGSFVTDGFLVGEEITFTGFATGANNGVAVVKSVSPSAIVVEEKVFVTEGTGAPVTVQVKIPALRKWENRPLKTIVGRPYIQEKLNFPVPTQRMGIGPQARVNIKGTLELKLVYPPNMGTDPIDSMASGLTLWFHSNIPPLPLDNGAFVHLRSASKIGSVQEDQTKCSVTVAVAFDSYIINPI